MSRFLDEKGRILGRLNVVDLLVFLTLIAIIAFAVFRLTGSAVDAVPVRVTYVVEAIRQATVDQLQSKAQVQGTVRDEAGTILGKVERVAVKPTSEEFMTPQGELKAFDSPIFRDVSITVLGEGTVSGGTVRVGSVSLRVGEKVTLVGNGYKVQSVIMDVLWGAEVTN